ncbi:hypothetical protein [Antarcticirhabdus aurantiaca]|uniref:Uncharacterized protein n=1 Tax=Antarcticirhabdus aurantiaca TaxID=2606717 RepID=A0ACD4NTE8_9HYPH|nr:hypothetical protein [Antarcticirhabdus aurantiaca]WAJ29975.1 hypothetical protein OXU80_07125 [Jeongeuplla avenae]
MIHRSSTPMRRGLRALAGASALAAIFALASAPAGAEEEAHAPASSPTQAPAEAAHGEAGDEHVLPPVSPGTAEAVRQPAAEAAAAGSAPAHGEASGAHAEAPAPGSAGDHAAAADHGEAVAAGGEAHAESAEGDGHEGAPPASWPTTRGPMPFEIVRSLEFLQDQIGRGNAAAMRAQQTVLNRFAPAFLSVEPDVWKDPRNLRAAVIFTMSGGPPSVLRGVSARAEMSSTDRALVEAALAYVENRNKDAARRLAALDLATMEPALAAQASLARAQLLEADAPDSALADIQRVRLLMPGTLLEEAALRMGVAIAEGQGEFRLADTLARRYFDAYARSAYAGNFRARFAAAYAERGRDGGIEVLAVIRDVTHALPDDERLGILLSVGRRALVMGNEALTAAICEDALLLPEMPPGERERAKLYQAAATIAGRTTSEARAMLDAIDRSLLHPADVEILSAAYAVVDGMATPVVAARDLSLGDRAEQPDAVEQTEMQAALDVPDIAASPVLRRGAELLDQISNDLQNTHR